MAFFLVAMFMALLFCGTAVTTWEGHSRITWAPFVAILGAYAIGLFLELVFARFVVAETKPVQSLEEALEEFEQTHPRAT